MPDPPSFPASGSDLSTRDEPPSPATEPASEPVVSVIVATYNGARWIEETIGSVLAQTYAALELIVVDDGSTDGTAALVDAAARRDGRVRCVRTPNAGAASARNVGARLARGQFLAFLDHDDLATPDRIARCMALVEADASVSWVYGDAVFFDAVTGTDLVHASAAAAPHAGDVLEPLLLRNFVVFSSSFVRRDVFLVHGGFDERPESRHIDDWELWLRLAAAGERLHYVPATILRYRWHAAQATQRMPLDEALRHRLDLVSAAVARSPERLGPLRSAAEAAVYASVARIRLDREERAPARRLFLEALRRQPGSASVWALLAATLVPRPALRVLGRLRQAVRAGRPART